MVDTRFYSSGELMADSIAFLAERLKVEGEKSLTFFISLSEDQWSMKVYTEDTTWKVRDILSHFVAAEQGFLQLFKDILAGGSGTEEDFDIDTFNADQYAGMRDVPYQNLIGLFQAVRADMISLVSAMNESDLSKPGRHPFLGETTIGEMIKMVYRHNQIHHRDIRKLMTE